MKIEMINENQIKCLLSKDDLDNRHIELHELAYGSEKATSLFKEMAEIANKQFGFSLNNTPVMIEAVPLANDSLSIIITKVEDPEELDTRFSRFSPFKDGKYDSDIPSPDEKINKANEILNLLNSFREALSEVSDSKNSKNPHSSTNTSNGPFSDSSNGPAGRPDSGPDSETDDAPNNSPNIGPGNGPDSETNNGPSGKSTGKKAPFDNKDLTFLFVFDKFDQVVSLSKVLKKKYHGENSLYRKGDKYILSLKKSDHTPEEFNQVCNILCEFGDRFPQNYYSNLYLDEHYEPILKGNALEELLNI